MGILLDPLPSPLVEQFSVFCFFLFTTKGTSLFKNSVPLIHYWCWVYDPGWLFIPVEQPLLNKLLLVSSSLVWFSSYRLCVCRNLREAEKEAEWTQGKEMLNSPEAAHEGSHLDSVVLWPLFWTALMAALPPCLPHLYLIRAVTARTWATATGWMSRSQVKELRIPWARC